jgi:hypothetical protein
MNWNFNIYAMILNRLHILTYFLIRNLTGHPNLGINLNWLSFYLEVSRWRYPIDVLRRYNFFHEKFNHRAKTSHKHCRHDHKLNRKFYLRAVFKFHNIYDLTPLATQVSPKLVTNMYIHRKVTVSQAHTLGTCCFQTHIDNVLNDNHSMEYMKPI